MLCLVSSVTTLFCLKNRYFYVYIQCKLQWNNQRIPDQRLRHKMYCDICGSHFQMCRFQLSIVAHCSNNRRKLRPYYANFCFIINRWFVNQSWMKYAPFCRSVQNLREQNCMLLNIVLSWSSCHLVNVEVVTEALWVGRVLSRRQQRQNSAGCKEECSCLFWWLKFARINNIRLNLQFQTFPGGYP